MMKTRKIPLSPLVSCFFKFHFFLHRHHHQHLADRHLWKLEGVNRVFEEILVERFDVFCSVGVLRGIGDSTTIDDLDTQHSLVDTLRLMEVIKIANMPSQP